MDLSKHTRQLIEFAAEADMAPLPARQLGRKRLVGALTAGTLTTSALVAKGAALGASTVSSTASIGAGSSIATTLVSAIVIGFLTGLVVVSPSASSIEKPSVDQVVPRVISERSRAVAVKPPVVELSDEAAHARQKTTPHESGLAVSAPVRPQKVSIARETELLSDVQRALKSGDPAGALEALNRYTEECPAGLLHEEATASRVVALCGMGREQDGRRWAEEFARRYPSSPLAPRVRSACPATPTVKAPTGAGNE